MNRSRTPGSVPVIVLLVLLVGVAAGLVLPGWLRRFDSSAALAKSANNLLQWGIALNLYLADNNDRLPEAGGDLPSPDRPNAWYNALPEYLSFSALTALPKDERPLPGQDSIWVDPLATPQEARTSWGEFFFSYGMNYWLQPIEDEPSFRIHDIRNPALVLFMAPTSGPRPGIAPETVIFRGAKAGDNTAAVPVLFTDGHVELKTRAEITKQPRSNAHVALWLPNDDAPDASRTGVNLQPLFQQLNE
ncbi:MAG: hypothetical protein SNJ52_01005 [Verrucomicrobiia bacterium]